MEKYESVQIKAIEQWKNEEPGILSQTFEFVTSPLTWAVTQLVPAKLVKAAIEAADQIARSLVDVNDIKHDAGITSINELRSKSLSISDTMAENVHNWAIGMGGTEGAALGATGAGGIVLDVTALITLSLRTIHKLGLCYGYERVEKQFVLGILSAACANSKKEKHEMMESLEAIEKAMIEEVWEEQIKDVIKESAAKGTVFFTAIGLGKQLGKYLARRKALQLVPGVGAVLGGATNIWFLTDVGWAARRLFQEQWLKENGYISVS